MCSGRGTPAKISDNSECFSSVIPRSLLRGASGVPSMGRDEEVKVLWGNWLQ